MHIEQAPFIGHTHELDRVLSSCRSLIWDNTDTPYPTDGHEDTSVCTLTHILPRPVHGVWVPNKMGPHTHPDHIANISLHPGDYRLNYPPPGI